MEPLKLEPDADWKVWSEENRAGIDRCIQNTLAAIRKDIDRRVPRSEEQRRNGFKQWLEAYRAKLEPIMEAAFRQEFPSLSKQLPLSDIQTAIEQLIWPSLEADLRSFALRGAASYWVSKHMGDATTIGLPEREGGFWRVPIGVNKYGENLGQIILDEDGNVIPERTTTREQILTILNDPKFSARTSATGQ